MSLYRRYGITYSSFLVGIGRGDRFVRAANGGVGTTDWMDIQSMLDHSISIGLTDPDRVAITGYSQGGFLTAWGITRPNNNFKAAVVGGGVSDWGMLSASSDLPDIEVGLICTILADHLHLLTNSGSDLGPVDCSCGWRSLESRRTSIPAWQSHPLLPKRLYSATIATR